MHHTTLHNPVGQTTIPEPELEAWITQAMVPLALALSGGAKLSKAWLLMGWKRTPTGPVFSTPMYHHDTETPGIPTNQITASAHEILRIATLETAVVEGLHRVVQALCPLISPNVQRGRFSFRWFNLEPGLMLRWWTFEQTYRACMVSAHGHTVPSVHDLAWAMKT